MKRFAFLALALALPAIAQAHDALPSASMPLGWAYPFACCAGYDCRSVPADWVTEKTDGYHIVTTDEVIPYNDKRLRDSPDGAFHWCSQAGADQGKTICLFAPGRGS